jgi:hypothetical protein
MATFRYGGQIYLHLLAAIMKKNGTGELQNPWWVTACLPTFGA